MDLTIPPVAAVCVYPNLVTTAKERLAGSGVKVASVATAFPSGQSPTELKVAEAGAVAELGNYQRHVLQPGGGLRARERSSTRA